MAVSKEYLLLFHNLFDFLLMDRKGIAAYSIARPIISIFSLFIVVLKAHEQILDDLF